MITLRPSHERGRFDLGWLNTKHTFSFGRYHDPEHMGFGPLRVINDDVIAPSQGFGTHPHSDMEIISIVLTGALEHKDSLGTHGVIRPGEVQRMTAGTGVRHSEFNPSATEPTHLMQIWILPRAEGLKPGYEQRLFHEKDRLNRFQIVASPDGRGGSVTMQQDALILRASLDAGVTLTHALAPGRRAWIQVTAGRVAANSVELVEGDGAAVEGEASVTLHAADRSDVIFFDLP